VPRQPTLKGSPPHGQNLRLQHFFFPAESLGPFANWFESFFALSASLGPPLFGLTYKNIRSGAGSTRAARRSGLRGPRVNIAPALLRGFFGVQNFMVLYGTPRQKNWANVKRPGNKFVFGEARKNIMSPVPTIGEIFAGPLGAPSSFAFGKTFRVGPMVSPPQARRRNKNYPPWAPSFPEKKQTSSESAFLRAVFQTSRLTGFFKSRF